MADAGVGLGTPFFLVPYVPWFELAVGAALIVQVAKPIPQFVAIILLLLYSALIAKRLSEGRRPPCVLRGMVGEADRARTPGPQRRPDRARRAGAAVISERAHRNDSTRASSRQAS